MSVEQYVDAVVVGAGFAGLYQMHLMNQRGLNAIGFERGSDVGGTCIGTAIPVASAMSKARNTPISFPTSCSRNGNGPAVMPAKPKFLIMRAM